MTELKRLSAYELKSLLGGFQFLHESEAMLQSAIETVLGEYHVKYVREFILNPLDRPDFLCTDVAIEVKIDGSPSQVLRQLHRYAQDERVSEILLVTTRSRHSTPRTLNEKPIFVLWVGGTSL